jgi:hypothetical protein
LVLVEAGQACAFDDGDVHEHILGAVLGLDEPKAFGGVEKLYGASSHGLPPIWRRRARDWVNGVKFPIGEDQELDKRSGLAETNSTFPTWGAEPQLQGGP